MKTQTKNLAQDWLGQGTCLITGGVSSLYLRNRTTNGLSQKSNKTNWGKHEQRD